MTITVNGTHPLVCISLLALASFLERVRINASEDIFGTITQAKFCRATTNEKLTNKGSSNQSDLHRL